ncbi:MAG TPA: MFS transporter [Egibacteraceae bacterium]|nr:MFS transporter [Egibacteraceae bacterium]
MTYAADTDPRPPGRPRLYGWLHPAVLAAVALSVASGFAQFGVFTALGDIATAFGEGQDLTDGVGAQLGLSATTLGLGLGLIRLAALGGLPVSAMADRYGRKAVLLTSAAVGLGVTALASLAPTYWLFIALFALGRPLLSATNAVVGVIAAEETRAADRAKAMALITAAYGFGAGLPALVRAVAGDVLGFRGLFALCVVPLLAIPLLAKHIQEPDRFTRLQRRVKRNRLGLGAVHPQYQGRLALICLLAMCGTFVTGPVNGYVFAYSENILGVSPTFTFFVVLSAAPLGLVGLLVGRWAADAWGRRPTCLAMHVAVGIAGIVTYSGGLPVAVGGYLAGLLAGSAYAPAIGALTAEVFPTNERATAAGWLTASSAIGAVAGLFVFGFVADATGAFTAAAVTVAVPIMATAVLYLRLPETRGMELEDSAPDIIEAV